MPVACAALDRAGLPLPLLDIVEATVKRGEALGHAGVEGLDAGTDGLANRAQVTHLGSEPRAERAIEVPERGCSRRRRTVLNRSAKVRHFGFQGTVPLSRHLREHAGLGGAF